MKSKVPAKILSIVICMRFHHVLMLIGHLKFRISWSYILSFFANGVWDARLQEIEGGPMANLQKFVKRSTWLTTISLGALCAPLHAQAQTSAQSENPSQTGTEIEPQTGETIIVVEGTRASIANSIDAKQNADQIVDVLSADDADRFPDNNLGEALSRLPGISFIRDEDSGDGEFISIRGLDAEFNTVLNNGIRIGSSNSFRRTPLDVATGDGVSTIYVTKAPLPEDASEGIGGVVDIRTRGALERSESVSLSAQIRDDTFVADPGFRLSGRFTKHLTDNLGINLSASFRRRFISTFRIDPTGGLNLLNPLTFDGPNGPIVIADEDDEDQIEIVPQNFIGVENFGLEEVGYRFIDVRDQTFNISGNIDWELSDTTKLTFGGTYNRRNRIETDSRFNFDADDDDFDNNDLLTFDDPEIETDALLDDTVEVQQSYFLRGETKTDDWQFNYIVGYSRASENNPNVALEFVQALTDINGDDDLDVTFAPFNAIGFGTFPIPNPQDADVFADVLDPFNCLDEDGDPCYSPDDFDVDLIDETVNRLYSGRFDATRFFDGGILEYIKAGIVYERSETDSLSVALATNDNDLDGIDVPGADIDGFGQFGVYTGNVQSFSPIGNPFSSVGFNGIPLAERAGLLNLRNALREGVDLDSTAFPVNNIGIIQADEEFYTGYIQAKLNFGDKFTIVGGVRLEGYEADFATNAELDAEIEFGDIDDFNPLAGAETLVSDVVLDRNSASNFEVLPRVVATYNFNDQARLRGAFTTSIARPNFQLLAGQIEADLEINAEDVDIGDAFTIADVQDVEATIEVGNPDLKNAYSYNFDLSFEYYFDRQNAISIAGFYKRIDDFIFSSSSLAFFGGDPLGTQGLDGTAGAIQQALNAFQFSTQGQAVIDQFGGLETLINTAGADLNFITPINGGTAEIYGIELGILHTFSYLPGALSNFGFIGNLTLQESSAPINFGALPDDNILVQLGQAQAGEDFIEDFDFFNSPNIVGNAALFYEDRNVEATLGYRYSGTQFESLRTFGLSQYQQARGFLDFDFEYTFRDLGPLDRLSFTFEASDILDGGRRATVNETYGRAGVLTDGASFNGRSFRLGVRARF